MLERNEKIVESRINDVQISERSAWKTQYFENTFQTWPEVTLGKVGGLKGDQRLRT